MTEEDLTPKQIMVLLSSVFSKLMSIEEKLNCIQHTVCKNDDQKTKEAICKFLGSNFRNRQH